MFQPRSKGHPISVLELLDSDCSLLTLYVTISLPCLHGRTSYCLSAAIKCGLNCSNTGNDGVRRACDLLSSMGSLGYGQPCTNNDTASGNWAKLYWGSNEKCSEGLIQNAYPGSITELLCCATSGCNQPGTAPPAVKCFKTTSAFSAGYCAGKNISFTMCAVSQAAADSQAVAWAQVRHQFIFQNQRP